MWAGGDGAIGRMVGGAMISANGMVRAPTTTVLWALMIYTGWNDVDSCLKTSCKLCLLLVYTILLKIKTWN